MLARADARWSAAKSGLSGYVAYTSLDVYAMFRRRWASWDGVGQFRVVGLAVGERVAGW